MGRTRDTSKIVTTPPNIYATDHEVVLKSLADAKGDLLAATAADVLGRLAIGSNNQQLVADSAASTGVKWAGSSGSGYIILGNGFIIQWGVSASAAARVAISVTFPIAFPNNLFRVVASVSAAAGFSGKGVSIDGGSTTNTSMAHDIGATTNCLWLAVGN
jgi:hypothetical protein